jgi:hypothetical protein
MAVTIMLVAAAVIAFRLAVLHLKIFPRVERVEPRTRWLAEPASAD